MPTAASITQLALKNHLNFHQAVIYPKVCSNTFNLTTFVQNLHHTDAFIIGLDQTLKYASTEKLKNRTFFSQRATFSNFTAWLCVM